MDRLPDSLPSRQASATIRNNRGKLLFVTNWRDSAWLRCSLLSPRHCNANTATIWRAEVKQVERANRFSLLPVIVSHKVTLTLPLLFASLRLERVRPIAQQSNRF
jgi:hypothetical protein